MKKEERIFLLLLVFLVTVLATFAAPRVFAAKIFTEPSDVHVNPDSTFTVAWFVDSEKVFLNAFQGKISYDATALRVVSVNDGGSVVNFWVEKPIAKTGDPLVFSGVTPGGYYGNKGKLFSVTFEAKRIGSTEISSDDLKAFLNDGEGTPAPISVSPLSVFVEENRISIESQEGFSRDFFPPEPFTPLVVKDENLYKGKYVLIWSAQDKDSGLDYFEVCEGRRPCVVSESPYVLKNQLLTDEIAVKAYDNSENERVAMIPPKRESYADAFGAISLVSKIILVAVFVSGIIAFFILRRR